MDARKYCISVRAAVSVSGRVHVCGKKCEKFSQASANLTDREKCRNNKGENKGSRGYAYLRLFFGIRFEMMSKTFKLLLELKKVRKE